MFMDEDDKLLDVAVRESAYLHDHGLFDASRVIDELLKQNAELLEALKGMKDAFCNPESGEIDKRLAVQDMNKAITKAEAVE